jgi:hypothetical protein
VRWCLSCADSTRSAFLDFSLSDPQRHPQHACGMFSRQAPTADSTDCDGSNLLVATDVHTAGLVLVFRPCDSGERLFRKVGSLYPGVLSSPHPAFGTPLPRAGEGKGVRA